MYSGASSGIGAATAIQFAGQGIRLSLHGRNMDRLKDVKKQCTQEGLKGDDVCTLARNIHNESKVWFGLVCVV